MWTYIESWLLKDGELPDIVRGSMLFKKGLRAYCSGVRELKPNEQVPPQALSHASVPDGYGRINYVMVGTLKWFRPETDEAVLITDSKSLILEFVPKAPLLSSDLARVLIQGELSIVPEYEWEAFSLPDVRADWLVRDIAVEYRQFEYFGRTGYPRQVVERVPTNRASFENLEKDGLTGSFMLDLEWVPG